MQLVMVRVYVPIDLLGQTLEVLSGHPCEQLVELHVGPRRVEFESAVHVTAVEDKAAPGRHLRLQYSDTSTDESRSERTEFFDISDRAGMDLVGTVPALQGADHEAPDTSDALISAWGQGANGGS